MAYDTDAGIAAPPVTKLWGADVIDGRAQAEAALTYMEDHDCPPLLGFIARAQIEAGRFGEPEVAFWQRIAERLLA
jgi:hypothetical protein